MELSIDQHIERILGTLGGDGFSNYGTLEFAEEAIRAHPKSAKLWCLRGDLIQQCNGCENYALDDALKSYQKALELDASCAEAWKEIGHYYDAILDKSQEAQVFFQKAASLRIEEL